MVLNRGDTATNVTIELLNLGLALDDWPRHSWSARDVWAKSDLGVFKETAIHNPAHDSWHLSHGMTVVVPAHGVRLLRMVPMAPPPPLQTLPDA
jgi:hypothetical protein